jgi:hypothetical protein
MAATVLRTTQNAILLATLGRFTVEADVRLAFDAVVQSCSELAKVKGIDDTKWTVQGKTKTRWREWGHGFYVQLREGTGEVTVEVYDLYSAPGKTDTFIKKLYQSVSTKIKVTSEPVVETVAKDDKNDSAVSEKPLESEGPPLLAADIPDDTGPKTLPGGKPQACPTCGGNISLDSGTCEKCGTHVSSVCPACGANPPTWARFCNSCGARL